MSGFEGKRFIAFLVSVFALVIGVMFAPAGSFTQFAQTVGLVFAGYAAGQSATDWIETKQGQ